jgi:hypothetical protein
MYIYVYKYIMSFSTHSTVCSERRLIGRSFYRQTSYERAAPLAEKNATAGLARLLSTWCRAAAFFSASGAAFSQEVPTVT